MTENEFKEELTKAWCKANKIGLKKALNKATKTKLRKMLDKAIDCLSVDRCPPDMEEDIKYSCRTISCDDCWMGFLLDEKRERRM